jgi:hypothetical protein
LVSHRGRHHNFAGSAALSAKPVRTTPGFVGTIPAIVGTTLGFVVTIPAIVGTTHGFVWKIPGIVGTTLGFAATMPSGDAPYGRHLSATPLNGTLTYG